jgi:carboxyl-terminal processing protease
MRYLFLLVAFGFIECYAQSPGSQQEGMQLKKVLTENHVQSKSVDDAFSKLVFRHVFDHLDPERIYMSMADITQLRAYQDQLDNEFNGQSWNFPGLLVSVYRSALNKAELNIVAACEKPFDFKKLVLTDTARAADDGILKKRIRTELELQAWEELTRGSLQPPKVPDYFATNEPIVRDRVRQRALRDVRRQLNAAEGFEKSVLAAYFRTFSMVFDPHSVYMSPTQMQNFIASLSTEGYYLGFSLDENDHGEIEITALHPGGPAWKSGAFNVGDVIERVRWTNKEWILVTGMTNEELGDILDESNDQSLEFSLRKGTGIAQNVTLRKEKFDTNYNIVRGFVFEGRHKIGYINLPDFYSTWGDTGGAQCANDVAKEIIKLKGEGVAGIIFDVRYNGGGSLREAVSMAGIFIDAGPVGIDVLKGQEPLTLKDTNRGTVWDGPLVLMVNGASASASEFLAAALQDYHRAVVVGSKTYGKGIAQELFSLETGEALEDFGFETLKKNWGFCAVTTSRMYRINGKSVQTIGVDPDITIPQPGDEVAEREGVVPFALPADSVSKKTYAQILPQLPLAELRHLSQVRIDTSSTFRQISAYMDAVKTLVEFGNGDLAVYMTGFVRYLEELRNVTAELETVKGSFGINLHEYGRLDIDEYTRSVNKAWIRHLSQDVSVGEAYEVVCDYIDALKHK